MADPGAIASLQETLAAQAFLRTIGADWNNSGLVTAAIAWYRVSLKYYSPKGGLKDVGYNPFFLKPGTFDKGLRTGTFTSKSKLHAGTFSKYATLTAGLVALAKFLLAGRTSKTNKFALVVNAFRSGRVGDALSAILQSSLAVGKYDAHYVTTHHPGDPDNPNIDRRDPYDTYVWVDSPLYAAYNAITNTTVPGKPTAPPKPVKQPPKPSAPQTIPPPFAGYMSPFAAGRFYAARHRNVDKLVQ